MSLISKVLWQPKVRYVLIRLTIVAAIFAGGVLSAQLVGFGEKGADEKPKAVATFNGLSEVDWKFIQPFDKPLLAAFPQNASNQDIREIIHRAFSAHFQTNKHIISDRYPNLRSSELLMVYLTLRVALSIPILDSGKRLQGKLEPMIMSAAGNCLQYGYRSSFVMDAFGLTARLVTLSTPPHIMGHAVADVYDPIGRVGALIDANKKLIFLLRDVDASFFETVLAVRDRKEREALLDNAIVIELPVDLRYFTPSEGHLASWRAGNKPSILLEQVRSKMAEGRTYKTRNAFLDGYDRLFTQKTRNGKNWWLRVHDMATWAGGHKTGIKGRTVVDNSRIQEIIEEIRAEKLAAL